MKGIIAIVTSARGDVVASAADFAKDRPGGCSIEEAQRWRATAAVKRKAVYQALWDEVAKNMNSYLVDQMWDHMERNAGFKITVQTIGGEET